MASGFVGLRYGVRSDEAADYARIKVERALDRLEAELGDDEYLVGDSFSVADLTAAALFYPLVLPPEGPREIADPPPGAGRLPRPLHRSRRLPLRAADVRRAPLSTPAPGSVDAPPLRWEREDGRDEHGEPRLRRRARPGAARRPGARHAVSRCRRRTDGGAAALRAPAEPPGGLGRDAEGRRRAMGESLAALGIETLGDLLWHVPHGYRDPTAGEGDRRPEDRRGGDDRRSRSVARCARPGGGCGSSRPWSPTRADR